jgi:hypothetical protein
MDRWCHTREYKTTSDGGLWAGKTVRANGSVLYVNKEFSLTYFHAGASRKQLNDLVRAHPGEMPRYIRNGGSTCAIWGNLEIQPVDPAARSLIGAATAQNIEVATKNNAAHGIRGGRRRWRANGDLWSGRASWHPSAGQWTEK